MPNRQSPRPLREREEFQVERTRNFEIRVRGLLCIKDRQVCPTDKTDKICQAFNVRKYSICDGPVFFKWENKNLSKWYVWTIIFFIQSHYIVRKLFTSNHFCVSICDELSDTCLCITGNLSGSLLCFLIC